MVVTMCQLISYYLIFLASVAFAQIEGRYRSDYKFYSSVGWFKLHQAPTTFLDAFQRCSAEGAVLASPLSHDIKKIMIEMQTKTGVNCAVFTGIHSTISKGDFTSIEGVPLAKIPVEWAPDEPDNLDNQEDCTIMLKNGSMADVRCNETYPYICYRKRTPIPVINSCGTSDAGYNIDSRTGNCYKFHRNGKTWRNAQLTCLAEGGHLAIINSPTEAKVIQELFAKNPTNTIVADFKDVAALGFLDWNKKGLWYTVHGQSIQEAGYASWSSGQPDKNKSFDGGSYCGAVFRNGLLDDVWCDTPTFAFICEKTPDSLVSIDEE